MTSFKKVHLIVDCGGRVSAATFRNYLHYINSKANQLFDGVVYMVDAKTEDHECSFIKRYEIHDMRQDDGDFALVDIKKENEVLIESENYLALDRLCDLLNSKDLLYQNLDFKDRLLEKQARDQEFEIMCYRNAIIGLQEDVNKWKRISEEAYVGVDPNISWEQRIRLEKENEYLKSEIMKVIYRKIKNNDSNPSQNWEVYNKVNKALKDVKESLRDVIAESEKRC